MKTEERDWNSIAKELNYSVKTYKSLTKMIVQTKQRAWAYGIDLESDELLTGEINDKTGKVKRQGLESLKAVALRRVQKNLKDFPIWSEWLANVPGIGPAIAGELVSLYYFKSIVICPKCNSDMDKLPGPEGEGSVWVCRECKSRAKGQGVLRYRVELRDFPTISSWWHFMGRPVVNGAMPKRKTGVVSDWSTNGRTLGYQIREQFNILGPSHKYRQYADKRKRYREGTHPNATKGHRHNMAWNETVKLFLSHFWQVAHLLDGQPLTEPWCVKFGGHDPEHIIPPYYWNGDLEENGNEVEKPCSSYNTDVHCEPTQP